MTASIEHLSRFLETEFALSNAILKPFAPASHNAHVLASVSRQTYHLTLRDLRTSEDTPEKLERILAWSAGLVGPTARVERTQVRTRSGVLLVPFGDLHLSVRRHLGAACEKHMSVATAVECASEHGRAMDAHASSIAIHRSGLRYRPVSESLDLIRVRLATFVAAHATRDELSILASTVEAVAAAGIALNSSRLVHGDLSFTNLIAVDGAISVIDHDCLHQDHPLYDHAHLLVSMASSEYFHGEFCDEIAKQYLDSWCASSSGASREELLTATEYVVLKKLALVQQPKNLHLRDRIEALQQLKLLRG